MKNVLENVKYNGSERIQEELEAAYDKALQNQAFYQLVTDLKLPKKELMKYTSRLESCAKEYEHCKGCKNIMECKNELSGYAYLPHAYENQLVFEYQKCKYQKEMDEISKYKKNMTVYSVPSELLDASLKEIDTKDKNRYPAIKWIQSFIKEYKNNPHGKGLYLYGNYGCGKSYFIAAMFSELAKKGVRSALVFWPEFLRDLKFSFDTDFQEKYESVKTVPLLLIDDIGAEVTTEWGRDEIFCPLIQYRMDAKLPTFFTSNLDLKLLEEHFSFSKKGINAVKARRIISRMEQLTDQIEMISENRRK